LRLPDSTGCVTTLLFPTLFIFCFELLV
jgi:hypothetical protein